MNDKVVIPKIVQTNIDRAVSLLNATGCQYKIIAPDGGQHGTLQLAEPKKTAPRKHVNSFKQTRYIDKIVAMKVGDVETFTPPEGVMAEAFRKATAGQGSMKHGNGAITTCIEDGVVQALRVK